MEETTTVTPRLRLGRREPAHIWIQVGDEPSTTDDIPVVTLPPSMVHLGPGIVALADEMRAQEATMPRPGTPSHNRREAEQQHRNLERQGGRGRPSTTPPPRDVDRTAEDDEHPPAHPGEAGYA